MQRKLRDVRDAQACLAAVTASGLPRSEWARSNGVSARSLNAWRLNLERAEARRQRPALVELVASPSPSSARYRVLCGDLAVEVEADFDADVLRRLIDVVTAC